MRAGTVIERREEVSDLYSLALVFTMYAEKRPREGDDIPSPSSTRPRLNPSQPSQVSQTLPRLTPPPAKSNPEVPKAPVAAKSSTTKASKKEVRGEVEMPKISRTSCTAQTDTNCETRWKALRLELYSLKDTCLYCLARGKESIEHKAYDCLVYNTTYSDDFKEWRKGMRGIFDAWKESPVHACSACGLPEVDYHRYKSKEATMCSHADNTWAVVYCVLRDGGYKDELGKLYPEVLQTKGEDLGEWLMRDEKKKGRNGMSKIIEWWLVNVCGLDLE